LTYTKGSVQKSKRLHLAIGLGPKDAHEHVPPFWKLNDDHSWPLGGSD